MEAPIQLEKAPVNSKTSRASEREEVLIGLLNAFYGQRFNPLKLNAVYANTKVAIEELGYDWNEECKRFEVPRADKVLGQKG